MLLKKICILCTWEIPSSTSFLLVLTEPLNQGNKRFIPVNGKLWPLFTWLGLHLTGRVLRQLNMLFECGLRLSDMLQRITLTYENTSQSEEPSEVGKAIQLCANQQEMQLTVKSLLQVLLSNSYHLLGY